MRCSFGVPLVFLSIGTFQKPNVTQIPKVLAEAELGRVGGSGGSIVPPASGTWTWKGGRIKIPSPSQHLQLCVPLMCATYVCDYVCHLCVGPSDPVSAPGTTQRNRAACTLHEGLQPFCHKLQSNRNVGKNNKRTIEH